MARTRSLRKSMPRLGGVLARFGPQIRAEGWLIGGSMTALLVEIALRVLEPWPLKFVIDHVIGAPAGAGGDRVTLLTVSAVALVAIAALRAVANYINRVGFALAGNRILTHCRGELFSHLQRLSLSFHDRSRTGDIITRVTGDIGRLKEVAVTAALPLVAHTMTLLAMLGVMLLMDWRLSLIAVAILPLFYFATRRLPGRIRQVARKQRKREGEIGATTAEAIGSIRVVQALSLEDVHQRAFAAQNKSSLKEGVKAKRLTARLIGTVDVLIAVATAVVLWFGATLVIKDVLTLGDLVVFLAYLKSAFRPLKDLAKYTGRIAKASASAERILEVLDTTPQIVSAPGAVDAPSTFETLRFERIAFGYTDDQLALDEFDLTVESGQVVALAGPSGAGKSTVLSLLLRLYDPRQGAITIDGRDIREFTVESWRRSIAVVPQENTLFAVSLRDNIAYGAPGATDEQIERAARLAGAHDFIAATPDGYDTVVGERGQTLSEGQRQRIAVARAAIREAPILVLDEPTASLDNQNNRMICDAVRQLSADRITFIIAHDLSTVQTATIILYLEGGRIVEQGTHEELLQHGRRYAAMHALQSGNTHAVPR